MIHLDANVLIRLSIPGSTAAASVRAWLIAGETLCASAPAWLEYISGPVSPQEVTQAEAILQGGIIDFSKAHSNRAADLFNQIGRKRAAKWDCMIAAAALMSGARLATSNQQDFQPFVAAGLGIEAV